MLRMAQTLPAFLLLITACQDEYQYKHTFEVPGNNWTYRDTANFVFDIKDTLALYDLLLDVEHSADFSNQNLYVKISTTYPSGQRREQVVSLELADPSGKWQGNCSGKQCHTTIALQENAYFNQMGKHEVTVAQYMRSDALSGIASLTFMLRKKETKRTITPAGSKKSD